MFTSDFCLPLCKCVLNWIKVVLHSYPARYRQYADLWESAWNNNVPQDETTDLWELRGPTNCRLKLSLISLCTFELLKPCRKYFNIFILNCYLLIFYLREIKLIMLLYLSLPSTKPFTLGTYINFVFILLFSSISCYPICKTLKCLWKIQFKLRKQRQNQIQVSNKDSKIVLESCSKWCFIRC